MKVFIDKILIDGNWSTKRLISILGTLCIIIYTFLTNDPAPIVTITMTAIGGNVANAYINKLEPKNSNKETDKQIL